MTYPVADIEGIGPSYSEKLQSADIATTDDLLEKCATTKGRDRVADATGLSSKLLLTWANMADLMRLSGVGPEYAELLVASGVDTVKELRRRNPANLAAAMEKTNEEKALTRSVPSEGALTKWIDQASQIEPRISH